MEPAARRTDPITSKKAALQAGLSADSNRGIALLALADAGANGLTDFELEEKTGKAQTSIGKRRGDLVKLDYVERAYDLAPRPSPRGAASIVWRVTAAGRAKARKLRGGV